MFAAVSAFLVPAAAPLSVLAQDRPEHRAQTRGDSPRRAERRAAPQRERGDMAVRPRERQEAPRQNSPRPQSRPDQTRPQARPQARPDGQRPQRPDGQRPTGQRPDSSRPDRPSRPEAQRPNRPDRPDRPNRPDWNRPNQPDRPGRPDRPNRPNRPDRPDWNRPNRPNANRPNQPDWNRPGRPDANRPNRPNRPGWNGNRDRDYREFHNRWNRDQWRRDWDRRHRSDWWRHDQRFRGWSGVRIGFYFAPGYGYYSVPRSYWNRQYYVGQYLPDIFWRYQVNDWRTYGLGYPPPGTRWVYVDNAIYLIDDYDGYIIEVVRDAWRW
jgi:Ni/Co efflux regulator RcnB